MQLTCGGPHVTYHGGLLEDKLHAGAKLPAERESATAMGVSRQFLRAALRALTIMHVLEIRQGDGTFISDLRTNTLAQHRDIVFQLNFAFHTLSSTTISSNSSILVIFLRPSSQRVPIRMAMRSISPRLTSSSMLEISQTLTIPIIRRRNLVPP